MSVADGLMSSSPQRSAEVRRAFNTKAAHWPRTWRIKRAWARLAVGLRRRTCDRGEQRDGAPLFSEADDADDEARAASWCKRGNWSWSGRRS